LLVKENENDTWAFHVSFVSFNEGLFVLVLSFFFNLFLPGRQTCIHTDCLINEEQWKIKWKLKKIFPLFQQLLWLIFFGIYSDFLNIPAVWGALKYWYNLVHICIFTVWMRWNIDTINKSSRENKSEKKSLGNPPLFWIRRKKKQYHLFLFWFWIIFRSRSYILFNQRKKESSN